MFLAGCSDDAVSVAYQTNTAPGEHRLFQLDRQIEDRRWL